MEALRASTTFTNLAAAGQKYNDAVKEAKKATDGNPGFANSLNEMMNAITALNDSPQAKIQDNKDRLNMAEAQAGVDRANEHSKSWLEAHDRLKEYANAVEQWVTQKEEIERAPDDIEKSFINIVKKNRLNRRDFAPFTDYVRTAGRTSRKRSSSNAMPRSVPIQGTCGVTPPSFLNGFRAAVISGAATPPASRFAAGHRGFPD